MPADTWPRVFELDAKLLPGLKPALKNSGVRVLDEEVTVVVCKLRSVSVGPDPIVAEKEVRSDRP